MLFVCEKRAAIDVVYARLRQRGLDSLCCLIHGSQADKKEFIQDLKVTYEHVLAEPAAKAPSWRDRRRALLDALRRELEPLEAFERSMRASPPEAGVALRRLIDRAIELADAEVPALTPADTESLPPYADWVGSLEAVDKLIEAIGELQPDGVRDDLEDPWAEVDATAAVEAQPAPAGAGPRCFERVGGSSRKFWEITVAGSTVTVRFGRIGTVGQTQQKLFADAAKASRAAERLVREKLAKGYVERAP